MRGLTIDRIASPVADAWVATSGDEEVEYSYGGTRKVAPGTSDEATERQLVDLMRYESHLKNRLINCALADGALDHLASDLPPGFVTSRVGGARCLFRPRDAHIDAILSDPAHEDFEATIAILFEQVGALLEARAGKIKLTPDFGKFSGVADILHRFTPHVLGIRREAGGCGGKASYTTTGIIAALDFINICADPGRPVTVIGSDGALGVDITRELAGRGFHDLAVADLSYGADAETISVSNGTLRKLDVLPSEHGRFTLECLRRGGVIVPATHGGELALSDVAAIPRGTTLALAHNLALPPGSHGRDLAARMQHLGVELIPGQVLTLGGALTSRIEWYSRAAGVALFDKPLAHDVVRATVGHLMAAIGPATAGRSLYDRMCACASFDPGQH